MDYSATSEKLRTFGQQKRTVSQSQRFQAKHQIVMARTPNLPERKTPIQDRIAALQQKIKLLECDHTAYHEITSQTIKENQETIKLLQMENQKLNKKLSEEKQLQAEREAKAGHLVFQLKEGKLHDSIKHLNALSHQAQVHEKRLEELESRLKHHAAKKNHKNPQVHPTQRLLENKLEEARLKLQDAEYINRVYSKIITHLQEEMPTFRPQAQQLGNEILVFRNEIKDLKGMKQNAIKSRNKAWSDLQHMKNEYQHKRSDKEQTVHSLIREAKARHRRKVELATAKDVIEIKAPKDPFEISLEEARIRSYEEALNLILEATGAIKHQVVLQRFTKQGETHKYLEKEKSRIETNLVQLKEKQEKTNNTLQEHKYSKQAKFQAKLSNELKIIEDLQTQLKLETKNLDILKMEAKKTSQTLDKVTSDVKFLAVRLPILMESGVDFPLKDLSLKLPVPVLLVNIGENVQNLQEQLEGYDVEEISRKLKSKAFVEIAERSLPANNVRIVLQPPAEQEEPDEEDSEEDSDVLTREALKKMSEQIIMANKKADIWCDKWALK